MSASVYQVNVSPRGGLPKTPVARGIAGRLGLEGDAVAHPKFHGGPQQALLLVCLEAIEEMKGQGYPLFPGALGENVTMTGIDRTQVRLGQRYRVGTALLEITKIRVPCRALDVYGTTIQKRIYDPQVKAGDFSSPRWGLSGFYVSVPEPGEIQAGDLITLVS